MDSQRTFNLDDPDEHARPMTSNSVSTSATKRAYGSGFGVALTSTPSHDERARLPSQQERRDRRKSAPGNGVNGFTGVNGAHRAAENDGIINNIEEAMLAQRKAVDRNSVRSYSYTDASKRRTQYYEEQFQYKDQAVGQTREKVVRQSPVVAELKTNVIVSSTRVSSLRDQWR